MTTDVGRGPRAHSAEFEILVTLRVRGILSTEELVQLTELDASLVAQTLGNFHEGADLRHHTSTPAGWALTTQGRMRAERLMGDEIERAGAHRVVLGAYEHFLGLNATVLALCTDWQVRSDPGAARGRVNDHTDVEYDREVVGRLTAVHVEAESMLESLGAAVARFAGYSRRLAFALDRVRGGDVDWFTRPTIESYHSVWFQLHEDLLASLGRQRNDEVRG